MPDPSAPGEAPEKYEVEEPEDVTNRAKKEDLWSPEYSSKQRELISSMIDMATLPRPEDEKERAEDMGRIFEDSLAHLGFKGIEIPENFEITPEIILAIGWAATVADKVDPKTLQPLMVQKLAEMNVDLDPAMVDQLGLIAYIYKVSSWRGTDGFGRSPYSEANSSREIVDRVVDAASDKEGTISADDIIKALSETNIRVGKKGLWEKTSENTKELIMMILTEIAGRLDGKIETDDNGKPYVVLGASGRPVEREELGEEEISRESFIENMDTLVVPSVEGLLEEHTEESLRLEPLELGGLVSGMGFAADNYNDLTPEQRELYRGSLQAAISRQFPRAVLEEINNKDVTELILTVK